ncbi:ATP-binding protein [Persephonella sp.]
MDKPDYLLLNRFLQKAVEFLEKGEASPPDFNRFPAAVYTGKGLIPVEKAGFDGRLLTGIERQKELVYRNTRKFVEGQPANHVLLWGERGTGKSSIVKSLIPLFYSDGLRLIQIIELELEGIFEIYSIVEKNSSFRFILFIDDLSFNENDSRFRMFKTLLDGTVYTLPENLLFYVTSNQKNLVSVKHSDRDGDFTRGRDVIDEKLSLVNRFGLKVGFSPFSKDTFLKIVERYAEAYGIKMDREELHRLAISFAREEGSFSGRTALHFIKSL